MDVDMDGKFHNHGKPGIHRTHFIGLFVRNRVITSSGGSTLEQGVQLHPQFLSLHPQFGMMQ